jgi:hypothetical protein
VIGHGISDSFSVPNIYVSLTEQETPGVRQICYMAEGDLAVSAPEAVELLFQDGGSLVFTTDTDWSLRVEAGRWPVLPSWCFPAEAWSFQHLPGIPRDRLGRCRQTIELFDEHGVANGVKIRIRRRPSDREMRGINPGRFLSGPVDEGLSMSAWHREDLVRLVERIATGEETGKEHDAH